MRLGSGRSQQKSKGVKHRNGNIDRYTHTAHVKVYVKGEKTTENSNRDPGRVPTTLLEIRGLDGNNDGHRDPEHAKGPE